MANKRKPVAITIIGLGKIGTSIGLALKAAGVPVTLTGHDREPDRTREALRRKAIDKGEWNLPRSVEGADLVILALPLAEIRETLQHIREDLRPNAVVMDTASVKAPVLAWAQEILPDTVHFVGGHPILRDVQPGQEHARADLFQGTLFALCPAPETTAKAVQLAADVVTALGAQPLFLDIREHDSMMAAVEHLPQLLALALAHTVIGEPAWREMRRLAGGVFEAATYLSESDPAAVLAPLLANREHLQGWLDRLLERLAWWRDQLAAEDAAERLEEVVAPLMEARARWIIAAQTGVWEEKPATRERFSFVDWLFGQSLARRWRQGIS